MSVSTIGIDSTTTLGTAVTAAGSANTKGSYAQITASSSIAAARQIVSVWDTDVTGSGNDDYLTDIATGAAASESIIFADLIVGVCQTQFGHARYDFPCDIAAGTRYAARTQCTRLSKVLHVSIVLATGTTVARTITTYGATAADSGGVEVDCGTTINTKGSWVELTASSAALDGLVVAYGNDATALGLSTIRTNGRDFFLDVGTGAAGAEVVVLANLHFESEQTSALTPHCTPLLPFNAPATTRIAVRGQFNGANPTATDRLFDIVLYGVSPGSSSAYPPAAHDGFSSCGPEPTKPSRVASLARRLSTWVAQGMPFTLLEPEDLPVFGRLFRSPRRPPYIPWRPQGIPETLLTPPPPPPPTQRQPRRRAPRGWPPVNIIEMMAILQRGVFDPRVPRGRRGTQPGQESDEGSQ